MTRAEKIAQMLEIRNAIIDILKVNYDSMEKAITEHSYTNDRGECVAKAHKLKMTLRNIRSVNIGAVSKMGELYEQ